MPTLVVARLNARVQPEDRERHYEAPLQDVLIERSLGEITGGGTLQARDGEIVFVDLEVELLGEADDATLALLVGVLESRGAPLGSKLLLQDGREVAFGRHQGLAVYLDGVGLPDEVYDTCDANTVAAGLMEHLGSTGRVQSHWQGPTETALYLYGPDAERMHAAVRPFLAAYPLCAGARVERVA